MELKEYQQRVLGQVGQYLESLNNWSLINARASKGTDKKGIVNFPQQSWDEVVKKPYRSRKDGIGEHLPVVTWADDGQVGPALP